MRRAAIFLALCATAFAEAPGTNTKFSFKAPASLAEWKLRREELKKQILWASGLDPAPPRSELTPRSFGKVVGDGYTVENIAIQTMPGFWLAGNLYRPVNAQGRLPAILHPHGHWNNGRLENTDNCSSPSLASALARGGAIVFAYDMVGYNDTVQLPHKFGQEKREQLWNFGPFGIQLWNSIRAADYLLSLKEVDPERLGMTGASGGGTQTFILTAVDDRIRASAPVNMVSFIMQGGCECENTPGLRIGSNNVEIASIAAPRPMLMVSATGDWTRNMLEEELPAVRSVYSLYGVADQVSAVRIDAPHNYNRDSRAAVYRFFLEHFGIAANQEEEKPPADLTKLRLLAKPGATLAAPGFEELFSQWKTNALAQFRLAKDAGLRERLARAFLPAGDDAAPASRFFPGNGPGAIFINGSAVAEASEAAGAVALRNDVRPLLVIEPSRRSKPLAPNPKDLKHVLAFNRSDAASETADILAALKSLKGKVEGPIEIVATGKSRYAALFAAALSPDPVVFKAKRSDFCSDDDCLARDFFVPGLQHAGGVDAAFQLLERRR